MTDSRVRSSGILAPLFTLPGVRDLGGLGRSARDFVDFLVKAKQTWFQMTPINPIDEYGSPYAGRSAFAGEALYLDLEEFYAEGLLNKDDLDKRYLQRRKDPAFPLSQEDARSERIYYDFAREDRKICWRKAFQNYRSGRGGDKYRREEERFQAENADWLNDYVVFQAAANKFQTYNWDKWSKELRRRDPSAVEEFAKEMKDELDYLRFLQLAFDVQWREFKEYCADKGIRLFGDVPIYVGRTSADVWACRELFEVDVDGVMLREAGVPADDFNPEGQRWNSPIYRWKEHRATEFQWWKRRMSKTISRFDAVRLDHFIGFYNYYSFPGKGMAPDPEKDRWLSGPREEFFDAIFEVCPRDSFIAEDLGVMNDGVRALRDKYSLPGMQVFQFSFDGVKVDRSTRRADDPTRKWTENYVAYTGTHDGAPILGWLADVKRYGGRAWESLDFNGVVNALTQYAHIGDPSATVLAPKKQKLCQRLSSLFKRDVPQLGVSKTLAPLPSDVAKLWFPVLRSVASSRCRLAIFPLQDVIGLSNDSRINFPGVGEGNWTWRLADGLLTSELADRLRQLTEETGRATQ